ncbi:MAG: lipid-A-disaccharide synthase N-terminal domain-containing protein [Proteobacteria bacterium]|nr:lipid-A-disaccharide synthase N-terminal domain-containing protein [Pseudomonadota bacterium]
MLIQFSQHLDSFLHDVFVTNFTWWAAFGMAGQLLFAARFIVQWWASEKAGRSVVPLSFWFFSIGGAGIVLAYGIQKRDPVIILGQALSFFIYFRNLALIAKERRERGKVAIEGDK